MESSKHSLKQGFAWSAVDRFSNQIVQFVVGIIIARMIMPEEYGILGILLVFINISEVIVDSGLGSGLIYHNDLREDELQTTFTFNLVVCLLLFAGIFVSAPLIETFFCLPHLADYLRVSSICVLCNMFRVVPMAILQIKLDFKSIAISNCSATVLSGLCGIVMAYYGYGIWALIAQILSRDVILSLLLFVMVRWMPSLTFSTSAFNTLYKYGVKIFGATCLTRFTDEGISLIIGKKLPVANLGLFTRGNQFASLPITSVSSIVSSVMFPALSSCKNDRDKFDTLTRTTTKMLAIVAMPILLWLAMCAEPLINILLTEKWSGVVIILQILCLGRILVPIASLTEQAMNSQGYSDLFLRQQVYKLATKIALIVIALPMGIIAVAIADSLATLSAFIITNLCARNVVRYNIMAQLRDILPILLTAFASAGLGYFVGLTIDNDWLKITAELLLAVVSYSAMIYVIDRETINMLLRRNM